MDKDTNNLFELFLEKNYKFIDGKFQSVEPSPKFASKPPKQQKSEDPNELKKRPMARRPGQRDAKGRMLPGQGYAQDQNQAQRDRAAQQIKGFRAAAKRADEPQPVPFITKKPISKTPGSFKNFVKKGVGLGAKGVGKALKTGLQAVDPFSKRGLLGKTASLAKDAENWARTGSPDPYDKATRAGLIGTGGKLDLVGQKSGVDQTKAIQDYRLKYIYPQDKNRDLNKAIASAFGSNVSFDDNTGNFIGLEDKNRQEIAGISSDISRDKPIKHASHLANIVLDDFVSDFKKGVPPSMAYNNAYNRIGNPEVLNILIKNKLLPTPRN